MLLVWISEGLVYVPSIVYGFSSFVDVRGQVSCSNRELFQFVLLSISTLNVEACNSSFASHGSTALSYTGVWGIVGVVVLSPFATESISSGMPFCF